MRTQSGAHMGGFNSRSRMGSDNDEQTIDRLNRVSIRAPAWGATEGCPLDKHRADVSIRAPAWGATSTAVIGLVATGVSIRAPAWGATRRGMALGKLVPVSIRAPAWGATTKHHSHSHQSEVSIRAPAWGATAAGAGCRSASPRFNSRSRMGSDVRYNVRTLRERCFNSRSRMGSDTGCSFGNP